jgi:nickel-dependent lactate racemase
MAGVTYIVNPLLNENLDIIGLVAGDVDAAFERGCELGRQMYATEIPEEFDIGIFNAFPKDTELCQAGLAMTPLSGIQKKPLREGGTIVMCAASPEGLGGIRCWDLGRHCAGSRGDVPSERSYSHPVLTNGTHFRCLAKTYRSVKPGLKC